MTDSAQSTVCIIGFPCLFLQWLYLARDGLIVVHSRIQCTQVITSFGCSLAFPSFPVTCRGRLFTCKYDLRVRESAFVVRITILKKSHSEMHLFDIYQYNNVQCNLQYNYCGAGFP